MYISFGLLLLSNITVYGEVIQCLYGGLNENSCSVFLTSSVLYRYYISNYGFISDKNKKLDKPYTSFKKLQSSSFKLKNIKENYCSSCNTTSSKNDVVDATMLFDPKKTSPEVFLKPLEIDENNIIQYWKYLLSDGTDTHKLKFHSKIVALWYENQRKFRSEHLMIILKSFYNAGSIHYFTKNNEIALKVAEEGLEFFESVKTKLYLTVPIAELLVWEILIVSLKIDAMNVEMKVYTFDYLISLVSQLTNHIENGTQIYPSAFLLMYRRIFLCNTRPLTEMEYPAIILNNLNIVLFSNSIEYNENNPDSYLYHIYNDLIYLYNTNETNGDMNLNVFIHILNALEKPILTTEDRLLNEKAASVALSSISDCVDINGWITDSDNVFCYQLRTEQQMSPVHKQILVKLKNMQIYSLFKNYDLKLILIDNNKINENNVHLIVTMTMNLDINSEKFSDIIQMARNSIAILEEYYNIYHVYRHIQIAVENTVQACKWLIELYGVLCNGILNDDIDMYQRKATEYLDVATNLSYNNNMRADDHFIFLMHKTSCMMTYTPFDWESHIKITGWIQSKRIDNIIDNCRKIKTLLETNNPFISKTDINILLYRYWITSNHVTHALNYLNNALKAPVVTYEERARNQEANELLSMHMIIENNKVT